ncbi:CRISPR-associated protein Cas4 [Ectothiorhodospiraceae bacterium BW-2]|nr:CRISPR-associated protein Cas4 [Ectothiorhodospiraceae bacterium BW-2]
MAYYSEDELLQLSGLQHLAFCSRQWALIHIEQQWQENRYTAEGQILHQRADSGSHEKRGDTITVRSLRLQSLRLGLSGIADVVEFHRVTSGGCPLPHHRGLWQPYPVEYKRGRKKREDWDEVQLCAQALCLEEMLQVSLGEGSLYYGQTHRRVKVTFTEALRQRVEALAAQMQQLWQQQQTPAAQPDAKCEHCSLYDRCLPDGVAGRSAKSYLQQLWEADD